VSVRRASADAAAFFRRASEATGMVPDEVTTDGAAVYPPALSDVLPGALHETGKAVKQRIERDHQHRKGRLGPMRGFKTLAGARVPCAGHGSVELCSGDQDWHRSGGWGCPGSADTIPRIGSA